MWIEVEDKVSVPDDCVGLCVSDLTYICECVGLPFECTLYYLVNKCEIQS